MSREGGNERNVREQEEEKQQVAREGVLRMVLTAEARERLTNIRMVKPDVARIIEDNIIRLTSAGRLQLPVSDEDVKKLLVSIQKPKREFKIKWG